MFSVGNTERWSVNHGQAQRSGYLGYGDFLAVEEKIPVQKSARLEVSPGKDKERAMGSVDGFPLCIAIQK